ncbi:universal stress protein [Streptomyces sp. NPDC050523]|uniref:universal stress protein n=1 Tax=Streptomyces sp. NPDC050523 TaxID=3365622 RepID=UPI00379569FF
MSSSLPVIVAVDGSDDSLYALDRAVDAARRRGAPLRVVHVRQYAPWAQPDVLTAGPPDPEDDPVLDQVRARFEGRAGLPVVEYRALEGTPGAVLPELGSAAQLLVLGSRGRGGFTGLLLGSNSMAAARDAECPVLVVPRHGRGGGTSHAVQAEGEHDGMTVEPGPRVVVGIDVDNPDGMPLAFAFLQAELRGCRLQAIAAYSWPPRTWAASGEFAELMIDQSAVENEIRTLAEGFLAPHRARHPDVRSDAHAMPGDAAGLLVAASKDAELVVVGRHRRRLLSPARMIGSVTQAVLLHAAAPVAVVPPTASETNA